MTRRTVWEETASTDVIEALDPGFDRSLDRRPDVLVIGGGVMGLATAAMCKRQRLGSVVLIEREKLAAAASGGAAAAISPEPHRWSDPAEFVELGRASLELYKQLDAEWGHELELRMLEWLIVLPFEVPPDAADRAGLRLISGDEARSIEPELGDVKGAVVLGEQGHVHPLRLAASLAARSGQVATGVEMTGYECDGGRVTRVRTTIGEISPGNVVFATGLAPPMHVDIGQRLVKGHLIATAPMPFRMRVGLAAPGGLAIQLPDGRIVFGGTLDEGDHSDEVREDVVAELRRELADTLPRARGAEMRSAWCCFRPRTSDEQPVIDRLPGLVNAWVTAGHYRTGILMAPATARAIASWIETGKRPQEVSSFSLSRFGEG